MAFVYENITYPSLNEFLMEETGANAPTFKNRLEFAHRADSKTIQTLESSHITSAANRFVEAMVSERYGVMLSTGITVDPVGYPAVYSILEDCCKVLKIPVPHTIITNGMNTINAMAIGTDNFGFIVLSDLNLRLLSLEENKFIIGHECGHIAMGHIVYHSLGHFIGSLGMLIPIIGDAIAKTISLPLNAWSRCSEITADRAGMVCCKDLKTAQRTLIKIVAGFTDISEKNIDDYIQQSRESLDVHYVGTYHEFFMSHPLIPKRLEALELFAASEMYYRVAGIPRPHDVTLLTDEQLNEKVNHVMKIMN